MAIKGITANLDKKPSAKNIGHANSKNVLEYAAKTGEKNGTTYSYSNK